MALRNTVVLITFVALALCGVCSGVVYRVGDSNGWTSRGLVDYNKWASTKDFHVADTLIFSYNNQFHNVMQVTDQDFQSCNTTSAMSTHTSGSDTITLKRPGHYYFLCGTLGHCQAGQKVDIKVTLPIPDNFLQSPPHGSSPSSSHPQVTISSSSALSNAQSTLHSLKLGLAITAFVLCL